MYLKLKLLINKKQFILTMFHFVVYVVEYIKNLLFYITYYFGLYSVNVYLYIKGKVGLAKMWIFGGEVCVRTYVCTYVRVYVRTYVRMYI